MQGSGLSDSRQQPKPTVAALTPERGGVLVGDGLAVSDAGRREHSYAQASPRSHPTARLSASKTIGLRNTIWSRTDFGRGDGRRECRPHRGSVGLERRHLRGAAAGHGLVVAGASDPQDVVDLPAVVWNGGAVEIRGTASAWQVEKASAS